MVKVLQVLGELNRGGAENLIMNLYRHIDRQVIAFDFVVHGEEVGAFEEEIAALGGQIFRCPKYSVKTSLLYHK